VGRVGSGFTEKETAQWLDRFEPLRREDPPVDDVPALDRRGAVWLEPVQVGEGAFGEWSPAGRRGPPPRRGTRPGEAAAGGGGSGSTEKGTAQWLDRFEPLRREDPPVDDVPALDRRGAVWLEPVQVGEVAFGEWSPAGRLRHPRWRGWRPDKSPDDVVRES